MTNEVLSQLAERGEGWRFDVPDADHRRGLHIVAITGEKYHSGHVWHRLYVGVAATMYEAGDSPCK